jgi:hypothetical protein
MRLFLASLAISQVVANPSLPEPAAEFVVVQNTGTSTVSLDGMRLTDSARVTRGVIPPDTNLEPGQRIVLQPNAGAAVYACTPVPHRALLTAWAPFNNTGDSAILETADGQEIDRVTFVALPVESDSTPCAVPPPRPGKFRFAATQAVIGESAPAVTLEVLRSDGTNGRVNVPWRAIDGSATRGSDYATAEGTVSFAAGQQRASLSVPLRGDDRDEPDETFTVVLGGDHATEPTRAVVRLLDDDAPAPPVLTPTLPGGPANSGTEPFLAPGAPATTPLGAPGSPPAQPASQGSVPVLARASLAVAQWQPVLRRRGLVAVVRCDRACDAQVSARIALGDRRTTRLATVRRALAANASATVRLRLPSRMIKSLRRALHRHGRLRATVTATPAGGQRATRRVWVR